MFRFVSLRLSQASISALSQPTELAPSLMRFGNSPVRSQRQIVGRDTPVILSTAAIRMIVNSISPLLRHRTHVRARADGLPSDDCLRGGWEITRKSVS